jgi:hypothetical protein
MHIALPTRYWFNEKAQAIRAASVVRMDAPRVVERIAVNTLGVMTMVPAAGLTISNGDVSDTRRARRA